VTLEEAYGMFDRSETRSDGEREITVPYCCGLPVVQRSSDGVPTIYCGVCRRTVTNLGRQWVVTQWGTKGIKLPLYGEYQHG
jgi:hypothetical protein